MPYILGLLLIDSPSVRSGFVLYWQRFSCYLIAICTLHFIAFLLGRFIRLKVQPSTGRIEWEKRGIILIAGSSILFATGLYHYKFAETLFTFHFFILTMTLFFIGKSFLFKKKILLSFFLEFIFLICAGMLGVISLFEDISIFMFIFSSAFSAQIVGNKIFKQYSLETNDNQISLVRLGITMAFFAPILCGLAGFLNILPRSFLFGYVVSLPFYLHINKCLTQNQNKLAGHCLIGFSFIFSLIVCFLIFFG